jgi:1-acyl-sn-glycerol-3-phosphate acyltransferase
MEDSSNSYEVEEQRLTKLFKKLRVFEKLVYRVIFPYKLHGAVKKYNDGPLVVVGNHYSIFDVVYPCVLTDKPIHFMAKSELWEKKGLFTWLVNKCSCIPVKRDGTDVQAVKTSLRILKNGGIVNIFPEGTRNKSYDDFLPFKSGATALAIKTHTPILPVVQIERVKAFHRIDVVVGEPIEFSKYYGKKLTAEQLEECDNELREILKNMRQAFIDKYNIKLKPLKK